MKATATDSLEEGKGGSLDKRSAPAKTVPTQKSLSVILDDMEQRANAATPGPWKPYCRQDGSAGVGSEGWGPVAEIHRSSVHKREEVYGVATFIAAARTDVPALVKALRRAIYELEKEIGHPLKDLIVGDEITAILNGEEAKENQNLGIHGAV